MAIDPFVGAPTENFGWVILIACSTFFLNFFQMFMIGQRRKKDGVPLPIMYSPEHPKFNGAQRAHQNTLEQVPFFLTTLVLAGIRHPMYAAIFGGVWILARIVYSLGYYTGNPKYRTPGFLLTMLGAQLPLIGIAISTAAGYLDWW